MISIAFDTDMMDLLLNAKPDENKLLGPAFEALLTMIERRHQRIVIPEPVLVECHRADTNFLRESGILEDPAFTVARYDNLARDVTERIIPISRDWPEITDTRASTNLKIVFPLAGGAVASSLAG